MLLCIAVDSCTKAGKRGLSKIWQPAFVFPMPDARFGMVRPSGKFKFLDRTILKKNGNLHKKAVLHALGIPFSIEPDRRYASGCPKGEEVCHITNYHIKEDFLDAGSKYLTIKEMMESKIRKNIISVIMELKEEKYGAGVLESVLKNIIPFHETAHKLLFDPTYEVSPGDIALDLASLGLTLGSLGASAAKSGAAGLNAAKATLAAAGNISAVGRASIIIRAIVNSYKTSSFLQLAGKELTDFVVPVFTTETIASSVLKGGKTLARKALKGRLRPDGDTVAAFSRVAKGRGKVGQRVLMKVLQEARTTGFTVEDAVYLVGRHPNSRYVDAAKGFVYKGFVLRGDKRGPKEIFDQGFRLRTEIKDLNEVNGFRGGFGGAKDALDIDGRGISTSPFVMAEDGTGADVYGRARGYYTYLVDARELEGYDLYKNAALERFRSTYGYGTDEAVRQAVLSHPRPLEVNYGTDIPPEKIVGAFDKEGRYHPNPAYKAPELEGVPAAQSARAEARVATLERIADFLERPGQWNDEAGDFAPAAIARALNRQIEIRDYPFEGHRWYLEARGQTSERPISIVYSSRHYDAYIKGRRVAIPPDGDCLFRAVLAGIHETSEISDDAVRELRRLAAQDIRTHPEDYEAFLA